MISDKYFL